uniref:Disks large-associated protein 5 n=1 Tax=Anopheles farauti TaxID=69004 RepID=A0A182QZN7_9DIPT
MKDTKFAMEFKAFFKNTSMGRKGEHVKMEVNRQKKKNRDKSRHEMRQAFRHIDDTEDENEPPPIEQHRNHNNLYPEVQSQQMITTKSSKTSSNNHLTADERYLVRLNRLQKFCEQKRHRQLEEMAKQKSAFVPFVGNAVTKPKVAPVDGGARKLTPLRERQEQVQNVVPKTHKTPGTIKKVVKARVDCWRTQQNKSTSKTASDGTEPRLKKEKQAFPATKSVSRMAHVKKEAKSNQWKQPQQRKAAKIAPHAVLSKIEIGTSSSMVTSTARKRKPLIFAFDCLDGNNQPKTTLLTANKTETLFDGISPIEVEAISTSSEKVSKQANSIDDNNRWEPQAVASLSAFEVTECQSPVVVKDAANEQQNDFSVDDWIPTAAHEINDTFEIEDDKENDEVFIANRLGMEDAPNRKPTLNESFTISSGVVGSATGHPTLTKFRSLIEHYEQKWSDRKVRQDDLDGFWLMLSLDLENLDKRFNELRLLKENGWQLPEEPQQQPKVKKLQVGGGIRKRDKKPTKSSSSVIANLIRKARQEQNKQKAMLNDFEPLKETVTVVSSPMVRRSARFQKTPNRKRSSLLSAGSPPTIVDWAQNDTSHANNSSKRRTIYPEIISSKTERSVKSILKTPRVETRRQAKSVLFLDSGLDTPQTRRRHSSRTIVDTPKPKIKFNDQLEIEHIDKLEARTPSRLDVELEKRRQRSLLDSVFCVSDRNSSEDEITNKTRETPRRSGGSKKQSHPTVRSSRKLSALFDAENENITPAERENGSAKRLTRSSINKRKQSHYSS